MICPVLHERGAAAIPCVTAESAHYLTSIRSGCTIGRRMSFMYRIAVPVPSMTTSGVHRPHIMPPQTSGNHYLAALAGQCV